MNEDLAPRRLVAALFGTLKLMQLYGQRHVATASALENLAQAARATVEDGETRISVRGTRLLVNGHQLRARECGTLALAYLSGEWRKRGIEHVRLLADATIADLQAFAAAFLEVDVTRPEPAERLVAALTAARVHAIVVERLAPEARDPVLLEERRENVMRAYLRGLRAFKDVLRCDGFRDRARLRRARRAVQGVVDCFLEDESAVLALAQLRSHDVKLFHHSLNVCVYALLIGQRLALTRRQLAGLGLAALFHDLGKTAPATGAPDEEERRHPARGARMLLEEGTSHEGMLKAAVVAYEHHVGCDRQGFPSVDHEPHLFSRIVAIADAYDALTAGHGSMPPLPPPDALGRMLACSGTAFDPLLLKTFANALGTYPVGSVVELSTGEVAIVTGPASTPGAFDRPPVRILRQGTGSLGPNAVIDLGATPGAPSIARGLPSGAVFADVREHVAAL